MRKKFALGHDKPLTFPLSQADLDSLGPTKLVSPCVGSVDPEWVLTDEQWEVEKEELEGVRYDVEDGVWPSWFFEKYEIEPSLSPLFRRIGLSERNPRGCANVVRMDDPFDLYDKVVLPFIDEMGFQLTSVTHQGVPFRERQRAKANVHADVCDGLDAIWKDKFGQGEARPREQDDWGDRIEMFRCPNHPDRGAGHGAAAGAVAKGAIREYKIPNEPLEKIVHTTVQWSVFRSFSAMHYMTSNLFGWVRGFQSAKGFWRLYRLPFAPFKLPFPVSNLPY